MYLRQAHNIPTNVSCFEVKSTLGTKDELVKPLQYMMKSNESS